MKLRDYQVEAVGNVCREWGEVDSTLVVSPTGTGKTIMMAGIVKRMFPRRVMVVAHRQELVYQAADKIAKAAGVTTAIEMGDIHAVEEFGMYQKARVLVSTIQTLTSGGDGGGRMTKFDPMEFGALIIDEAHHACAGTYMKVIQWMRQNKNLKVLGVTATPDRADEEALGKVFQSVAHDYEIHDAIRDGWLVPVKAQSVEVDGLDLSEVKTTAGDLNGAELAAILENEKVLHGIASPAMDIIGGRRALAFTGSVRHAETLAGIFNRHRQGSALWVCGMTPKEERREILRRFASGETQIVCNCGVLTEGFDDPGVEVVLMARPTKSRSLYAQMVGRATRPLPGVVDGIDTPDERRQSIANSAKNSCLVVDFVGNSGRHRLVTSADILGGNYSEEEIKETAERIRKEGRQADIDEELAKTAEDIRRRRLEEEARKANLKFKAKYTTSGIDPFSVFGIKPAPSRGWDEGKRLSEKQREILEKQGIEPDAMPYAQAKQVLNEVFKRFEAKQCSFKQAKLLQKHGLPGDVSMEQAKVWIDSIANNNWRLPPSLRTEANHAA